MSLPTEHIGLDFVNCVPARGADQPAYRFPALPFVDFCRPSHVEYGIGLDFRLPAAKNVIDFSAADSKLGLTIEMLKALLEIIGRKSQVPIKFHDEFPVVAPQSVVAGIERVDDTAARL